MKALKQIAQVREELSTSGETVADWAMRHRLKVSAVYHLLNGNTKGVRGDSYRAAVLLGLKRGTVKAHAK